jgi:transposase
MHDKILKYSVGVDMSGKDFKACFSQIDFEQKVKVKGSRKFTNTSKGYQAFHEWLQKYRKDKKVNLKITVEATGIYHEKLSYFLYKNKYAVCVVLPNRSKKYLESLGFKSKTDKLDAKGLAQMGAEQNLQTWQPFSNHIYELKTLTRHRDRIQKLMTSTNNQLHAHENMGFVTKSVVRQLRQMIKTLNKQLDKVELEINKVLQKDEVLAHKTQSIAASINGVGLMTVATIAAETNGFQLFSSAAQLTSFAGYDVVENESGKRKGKTKISKKGNSHIRKALHFPALNVVRLQTGTFPNLFNRVFDRTRIPMKGYVAVQRKLLCLIFSLWKNDQIFDPQFHLKKQQLAKL